jgi:hypothetical protein
MKTGKNKKTIKETAVIRKYKYFAPIKGEKGR